jgi:Cu/Ag efflux protein CusF
MRTICIILVFALTIGVGAAYGFHWWGISTGTNDQGKSEISLTIDKDKVKHDVNAAKDEIKRDVNNLKPGHKTTDKAAVLEQPVAGTIRTIDAGNQSLTMMDDKNAEFTVKIGAATRIRVEDKEGTLTDLKVGDSAAFTYEAGQGEKVAKTVTVAKRS